MTADEIKILGVEVTNKTILKEMSLLAFMTVAAQMAPNCLNNKLVCILSGCGGRMNCFWKTSMTSYMK